MLNHLKLKHSSDISGWFTPDKQPSVADNMRSDGTAFDVQVSVVKDTASTSFKSDINFSFHITIHHLNPGFYCIS
jgi:hypothetical protein